MGLSRQPLAPDQQLKLEGVRDTLACSLSEEGYANEPVGGCPAGRHEIDPLQVSRIVRTVLEELKQRDGA